MSKQTYNNQTITEYLLGSLPETETERFDELSITNDEFADALKAAERDLVDAYVQGELTGAELERFKFHYLASPLRHEKVDFAQAFQVLAERNAPAQEAGARLEVTTKRSKETKTSGWFSTLSVFTDRRLALQWGFAAMALAFLIAGGWLALENVRLRQQVSQTQTRRDALAQREHELQKELDGQRSTSAKTEQELAQVAEERRRLEDELKKEQERDRLDRRQQPLRPGEGLTASFILAPQMRGIEQVPTVSIPAKADYVFMQLELEPNDYPAYRVALVDPSNNQVLWRSSTIKARATGDKKALSVRFRADLLKPQTYLLQVSGAPAIGVSEVVGDYLFRVVR
ncbi:MAG: hypothetical protein M3410_17335 [Acidobacteriota bacterium]|nr:hypothetical protein [Acidobacteriota bacterium]